MTLRQGSDERGVMTEKPTLSVVIVTYNPRRRVLEWAIDSIERQSFPKDQFELVIVDNNSDPPLEAAALERGRSVRIRLVREPQQGNVFARCAGIVEARSDLIVFVDDDNYLAPDYLEKAVRIAREAPEIGVYSGICEAVIQRPVPLWKRSMLPHLLPYLAVRDYGPEPITSNEDTWGPWEPPTSGMVLRKDVGMRFVEFVRASPDAHVLGRKGTASLLSCEDSLLARMAYRLGYWCSYQPSLRLYHYIPRSRLRVRYLVRLLYGLGRSYIILERVLGKPLDGSRVTIYSFSIYAAMLRRLLGRLLHHQLPGLIMWSWDVGYLTELWRQHRRPGFS